MADKDTINHERKLLQYEFGNAVLTLCKKHVEEKTLSKAEMVGLLYFAINELVNK
jgi:hypothetical protein